MDLVKMSLADLRSQDSSKSVEIERQIRKELALLKMDVYGARTAGKTRGLRKTLARVLTVRSQKKG
jgi:ribosomal protein L29